MNFENKTALITGCSSGIGLHLARKFALHRHPLVLVAPDESELRSLAGELSAAHGIAVEIVPADLEEPDAAARIAGHLRRKGIQIDILVNNAGHGFLGNWWDQPLDQDLSMLRLNVEAVLRLTKELLPPMVARGEGCLLNTASIAGFEAGPKLAVYHATKAFVLSWSEALSVELADSGVQVTVLCPGPTDTDFFPKAGMLETKAFQKGQVMAPQEVAKAGYDGMIHGKLIVVPGAMNKALVQGRRLLTEKAQAELNGRMYEETPPAERKRSRGDVEGSA